MEEIIKTLKGKDVHKILAHSYSLYLGALILGVLLDLKFHYAIFSNRAMTNVGIAFLVCATILIVWAQHTSRNLKTHNLSAETFMKGPYRFSRTPTHFGLFFLVLGFGIIYNALFVVLFTVISFVITKSIFVRQQEQELAKRYGAPYIEYQNKVRF